MYALLAYCTIAQCFGGSCSSGGIGYCPPLFQRRAQPQYVQPTQRPDLNFDPGRQRATSDLPPTGVIQDQVRPPQGQPVKVTENGYREIPFAEGMNRVGRPDLPDRKNFQWLTVIGSPQELASARRCIDAAKLTRVNVKYVGPDDWCLVDIKTRLPLGIRTSGHPSACLQSPSGQILACYEGMAALENGVGALRQRPPDFDESKVPNSGGLFSWVSEEMKGPLSLGVSIVLFILGCIIPRPVRHVD